ncbi:MAG: hypothetical protein K6T91_03410 [Firmicutes bacterium]|nr:hypothetical protein [Bacillota bacterium]
MTFSKTEDEIPNEPADEGKTETYNTDYKRKGGKRAKHEAEYQCEWPSQGEAAPEKHKLHHHSGREQAALVDEEDLSPEPGNPDFWPSAELDQDETWEPPARNKPDSSPWCEIQEGEE